MTFCQSKGGIPYFETSAKEAVNVEQAFEGKKNHPSFPKVHHKTMSPSKRNAADNALFIVVIARNALAQEESEEFSGDFSDPIDIHLDRESDGCAC